MYTDFGIQTWNDVFTSSLKEVWGGVAHFAPNVIMAIIIFAIGWVLAALIAKLVESLLKALKVDAALKSAGLEEVVKRAGHNLNAGLFVGTLVKWFVIVVFLMVSFNILGLAQVNDFLRQVADFLPKVIYVVFVLMVAVVVASALQKIVVASARAANVKSAELIGRVAKWSVWAFAIIVALDNLIMPGFAQGILTPLVFGIALAFGLSFGLGGKETAQKIIEKTSHHILEKE